MATAGRLPRVTTSDEPTNTLGLPASGKGSLATWSYRVAALLLDWAACTIFAFGLVGAKVITAHGGSLWTLMVFFIESSVLTIITGGSFGQLIAGIGVIRTDGQPLGWWRPIVRSALKCVVIPVVVIGANRQHLADMLLGTAVVARRSWAPTSSNTGRGTAEGP